MKAEERLQLVRAAVKRYRELKRKAKGKLPEITEEDTRAVRAAAIAFVATAGGEFKGKLLPADEVVRQGYVSARERREQVKALLPDAVRGRKLREAAKVGHTKVHGTAEEKQERWAQYQADLDALRDSSPHLSFIEACKIIAKRQGVHFGTIKRHTLNRTSK